jgi:hypothetical protein
MRSRHLVDPETLAALDQAPELVFSDETLPAIREVELPHSNARRTSPYQSASFRAWTAIRTSACSSLHRPGSRRARRSESTWTKTRLRQFALGDRIHLPVIKATCRAKTERRFTQPLRSQDR